MKTPKFRSNHGASCILLAARLLVIGGCLHFMNAVLVASAQTIVSGPTISGTWSPSGNPYIVSDSVTVPSGQALTIQAGAVVWIGSGVSITNNGLILAVGTPTQHIAFQAPVSSQYWGSILNNYSGTNDLFTFCDFQNATNALILSVFAPNGANVTMATEILSCTFSNCVSQAILGQAEGYSYDNFPYCNGYSATISPIVENCIFYNTGNGCKLTTSSGYNGQCGPGYNGYASPMISANVFENLSGTAFLMQAGSYAGSGTATFVNNTIVNCQGGINAVDPWNAQVENNIFLGCTNAVVDTGTLSRKVQFNDFYNNVTNFTGYASTYGQWIIPNRNGTLADILYNISQNPLFVAANNFQLQSGSPCVNAGQSGEAFANMCSPPSVGTNYGDIGAYGGPYACNWLTTVPVLPTQLSLTKSNSLLWLNFAAIPRSTYKVQYITTNLDAIAGTNLWLTNSTLTPAIVPVSLAVSPFPTTNKESLYRVRSLGRSPGN